MYVIANWKMATLKEEPDLYVNEVSNHCCADLQVIICPAFLYLDPLAELLMISNRSQYLKLGAQNVAAQTSEKQTGEISAKMLADIGAQYCIVGHSERRSLFQETDRVVNHKIKHLQKHGLGVILCVGHDDKSLKQSVRACLDGAEPQVSPIMVAYEPKWSIGKNTTASPTHIQDITTEIRRVLKAMWPHHKIPVLYGGGVHENNVTALIKECDLDGLLCGGVSLKSKSFTAVLQAVSQS